MRLILSISFSGLVNINFLNCSCSVKVICVSGVTFLYIILGATGATDETDGNCDLDFRKNRGDNAPPE
jgi:hypothetical protein